jgi:hypothetical protein
MPVWPRRPVTGTATDAAPASGANRRPRAPLFGPRVAPFPRSLSPAGGAKRRSDKGGWLASSARSTSSAPRLHCGPVRERQPRKTRRASNREPSCHVSAARVRRGGLRDAGQSFSTPHPSPSDLRARPPPGPLSGDAHVNFDMGENPPPKASVGFDGTDSSTGRGCSERAPRST